MSQGITKTKETTRVNTTNRAVPVEITRNKFISNGEYGVLNLTIEWPAGLIGIEGCDVRVLDIDLPLKNYSFNGKSKWIVNPMKSSSYQDIREEAGHHHLVKNLSKE